MQPTDSTLELRRSPGSLVAILTLALLFGDAAARAGVGVSALGAQRFVQDTALGYGPQADDAFAAVLAVGDFNGDGADDLATGVPGSDGLLASPILDCGIVALRYGVPGSGLTPGVSDSFLGQSPSGVDPPEAGDGFGGALASCDFNGDAYDDLAVGVPGEKLGTVEDAGAVEVFYGTVGGLPPFADHRITQETSGVPGSSEVFDAFGAALACGDFDGDGFADLAIGEPGSGSGAITLAGSVTVLQGSANGLLPAVAVSWDQDSPGVVDTREALDYFGSALAAGDFDGDGFDDLAIGVPGEDNPGIGTPGAGQLGRGAVAILFGSPSGLGAEGNLLRTESALGGVSENGDRLGSSLAAGDFDGDGFGDLAIGVPYETLGGTSIVAAGQVVWIHGAASGFDFARTGMATESDLAGAGASEPGDRFGFALAAGDFDGDGADELAIGHPGELTVVAGDGALSIVPGSPTGLDVQGFRTMQAGVDGFPGEAGVPARGLGTAFAVGDFDGNGHADLVIGAPGDLVAPDLAAGAEIVLRGACFADGFESGGLDQWTVGGS